MLLGFSLFTVVLLRGDFSLLRELELELNLDSPRTNASDENSAGKGIDNKAAPIAEQVRSPKEILKSQFNEVLSGRAVNSTGLDKLSDRLFRREMKRIERDLRDEMQRETWKIKDRETGKIRKLKQQRVFEPEELEYYKSRRQKDAARVLGVFSSSAFSCSSADACREALKYQLKTDLSFSSEDFKEPYFEPCIQEGGGNVTSKDCHLSTTAPALQYGTCAVVGNSGVMKNSKRGGEINRSNAVFRVNQAPTSNHIADVGDKTNVRVLNNAWAQIYAGIFHQHRHYDFRKLPLETNATLILTRSNPRTYQALLGKLREHTRSDVKVYQLSQNMMQRSREVMLNYRMLSDRIAEMENRWKQNQVKGGTTPSTGFISILLAQRLCKEVSVYGLSKEASRDAASSSWTYHYFQQTHKDIDLPVAELRAHPHHSFRLEGIILNRLSEFGLVAPEMLSESHPMSDWTEPPKKKSFGCPVVRKPKSDCGGGDDSEEKRPATNQKAGPNPSQSPNNPAGNATVASPSKDNRARKRGSSRSANSRSSQSRNKSSSPSVHNESNNASNTSTTPVHASRPSSRKGRARTAGLQSTEIITKTNRNRARARRERGRGSEEDEALQEILRAQREQNENEKKLKGPQNLKHVPLDKIQVSLDQNLFLRS